MMRVISMARGVAMLIGIAFDIPRATGSTMKPRRSKQCGWRKYFDRLFSGDGRQLLGAPELLDIPNA
jgi:hypothetical protein